MTTFNKFLSTFDSDASRRGKQFEVFVKWFLKNDPDWSSQVDTVWLWDEYPHRWGPDCGIDLVFKHKNGETWAVQAKCYSSEYQITKYDVDKFLSESSRKEINKRLLIATTDKLGVNARQVCEAQEKQVIRYLLSHFEDSNIDYPSSLSDLSKAKTKTKPSPKPHQIEAIEAVKNGFETHPRGQLIMACGTGKTYTTLWIKEKIKPQTTLVLLPSLSLLSQTLHEWIFASNDEFEALCVCSDISVSKRDSDELVSSVSDLAFPVTSNTQEIASFLKQNKPKVIFSTYQSSPLIAEAQLDSSVTDFDLVVADEAHRCAGKVDGSFSTVLDGKKIRSTKRLFTTATPRTYSTQLKKLAEERGVEIYGMDDEEVFGTVLYKLNFGEAIRRGLLTDYQVVVIGIDDETVGSLIGNREFVKLDPESEEDAESLAIKVGLLKAIKDFDLRRVISFHSRVNRAKDFSEQLPNVLNWIDEDKRPVGNLKADFVSGEMATDKRRLKLSQLKEINSNERALLTNARCLSEGVDVPTLDGVAFIDPKGSQADIIQAVGRAIRLSPNKEKGTIILPVFIESGANEEISLTTSRFKPVWDVLNALKAHDDVLADELDQMRVGLGRRSGGSFEIGGFSKIEIDLPISVNQSFVESIKTLLVESVTDSWEFWFGLLEKYIDENGDSYVSSRYVTDDGYQLGQWVSHQRRYRNTISSDRKAKLNSLPTWSWDLLDEKWEEGYRHLKLYREVNQNCSVPLSFETSDGYKLGRWVGTQRAQMKNMSDERKKRLEQIPDWKWSLIDDKWEESFQALLVYKHQNSHSFVPTNYKLPSGYSLGKWVSKQRQDKGILSDERKAKLLTLGDWVWDVVDHTWEKAFQELVSYVDINKSALVPSGYKSESGFTLGSWITKQRINKEKISEDKVRRLESLEGWSWDPLNDRWDRGFEYLKDYSLTHGNVFVPPDYELPDGFKLGQWIGTQRRTKDSLSDERRSKLEGLTGWVWSVQEAQWNEGIQNLIEYSAKNGDCLVPQKFVTESGYRLGNWVSSLRVRFDTLSNEKQTQIENISGWVRQVFKKTKKANS
jgi:superfamily II DNA or RNA helicase